MNPCNTTVSNDFMVALSRHSGLRAVIVIHRPCPHVLEHCPHHCWETNFSNVPLVLFGQAFINLQDIYLVGAGLSVDQFNTFFAMIASEATTKKQLGITDNRLWDVEPLLLAQAVIKFRLVELDRMKLCATNSDPHAVALFNALGESSSCTTCLDLTGFDLSGVDPDVLAKQIVKMISCCFNYPGLTPEQSSAITTAVSNGNSNPYQLEINTVSNTVTELFYIDDIREL